MTDVVIFGAGGLGRLVLDILLNTGQHRPVAFLDSNPLKHGGNIDGVPIRGDASEIRTLRRAGIRSAIVAVGDAPARVRLAEWIEQQGMQLVSAIHPLASIAPSASLGHHLIIGARTIICVHAAVGEHSILLSGSIVEHDNMLGVGVFLQPAVRLAGGVRVDDYAALGIGACVIPYRRVGHHARVEPGAVVIRDVMPGDRVAGVPATRESLHSSFFVADPQQQPARDASLSHCPTATN